MDNLNNMRKQGTLCDVTLVVQGKFFAAHRAVLAAGSHFFTLMFTTKMLENTSEEVVLYDVEATALEQLIDFFYTAKISVNSSNVESLLKAANQYLVEPVKRMCVVFLKEELCAENCLGIHALSECTTCEDLDTAAETFALLHFTDVFKVDEFLKIDVGRLTHLLTQDKLTVDSEEQVYEAAVRWLKYDICKRRQYVVTVLGCVRFPFISKSFLSSTVQAEPLIQDNLQCMKMAMGGMGYHLTGDKQKIQPRRQKSNHFIAAFGGLHSHITNIYYFNHKECTWTDVGSTHVGSKEGTSVYCRDMIYIMGGLKDHIAVYNVLERRFFELLCTPLMNRKHLAACAFENKIYTSGGAVGTSCVLSSFECFDTKTGSWQEKPNMLSPRHGHGSVEVNGLIYVCGGSRYATSYVLYNCEVFNPNTDKWTRICRMNEARKNHGLVVVNNKIYAVGGQGTAGGLDSLEYYDTDLNKWYRASPIPWRGVSPKCAAVGEKIYVLSGKGVEWKSQLKHVLEYNTRTDRWIIRNKTKALSLSTCLVCEIKKSENETQ
ncbi:unnamed protein product [Knipowitschia caucasica]|uniref:BTB domain-containing protein n=1 Tax=Knipowitschia caucasica TaxID=637954 RepID=A0AAV2K688_KNICA